MKKNYKQPLATFVEISVSGVLAVSGDTGGAGSSIGSGTVNPEEAWTNEARGDWSDIWSAM